MRRRLDCSSTQKCVDERQVRGAQVQTQAADGGGLTMVVSSGEGTEAGAGAVTFATR